MTMWPNSTAAAGQPTGTATREYRAMWTFAISGGFNLFAVIVLTAGSGGTLMSTGAFFGALLFIAVSLIEARGLSRGRDWARYAMTPMLWIFVGSGILALLVALSRNSFNISIAAILAAWALYARPSASLGQVPASSIEGTYLILGAILAGVVQFL